MSTSRKILRNIFSLSLAEAASKGIALITAAYLTRIILAEGFGIIGFANAIAIYFLVIVSLGFNTVGIREIARSKENITRYVNSIISIRFIIATVSCIILACIVLVMNKPPMVKLTLLITGLNFYANAFLLDWVYQGIEKMEVQALRQVVTGLLTLVGTLLLVHGTADVFIAMAVSVISAVLNAFWMLMFYMKTYGRIKFTYDKELWVSLMKASIPIGMTALIIANYNNLNIILLGFFRNDFETGIYSAAYRILVVTILPSSVIQNAFFPALSRATTVEDRSKIMFKYSVLLFIIVSFIAGIVFTYSEYFIVILFGSKFANSIPVLKVLMISSVLMYINVSFTAPLMAWHKEKKVMYAIGIGGIASTVANFIAIPYLGYMGAAYVTILSELVVFIGLAVVYSKLLKNFFLHHLLKILLFSVIGCGTGIWMMNMGINVAIALVTTVIIYITFNFVFKTVTVGELKGYFAK